MEEVNNNQAAPETTVVDQNPAPNQKQTFGKSELLDAQQILSEILGIKIGNVVGDLGSGGGLFSMHAARLVGEQGQVYSVDIMKTALSDIESKARMSGLHNIKTVWSNLEMVGAAKINEASLDFALAVNVLFQSKKHFDILSEAVRLLKPGGKLLIIDWSNTGPGFTPPSSMQVSQEKIMGYATELDLELVQQFQAGQYHFGLIFMKK